MSDTFAAVYDFIDTHEQWPEEARPARYQLFTNMPKQVFSNRAADLRSSGLGRKALLYVEEVEDAHSESAMVDEDEGTEDSRLVSGASLQQRRPPSRSSAGEQ
jgi:hypothetical protein